MRYYPICLDIKNKKCLMVGGGAVATRKVKTLIDCGAIVTVVSLEFSDELNKLSENGMVVLKNEDYNILNLENIFLVFSATDNEKLNLQIANDAKKLKILCNIADLPVACNFILPAVVNRGDLSIAVSTSGQSPALAKQLRIKLEKIFGDEYSKLLSIMGELRKKLLNKKHNHKENKHIFKKLLATEILEMIKDGKNNEIDLLLQDYYKPRNLI